MQEGAETGVLYEQSDIRSRESDMVGYFRISDVVLYGYTLVLGKTSAVLGSRCRGDEDLARRKYIPIPLKKLGQNKKPAGPFVNMNQTIIIADSNKYRMNQIFPLFFQDASCVIVAR